MNTFKVPNGYSVGHKGADKELTVRNPIDIAEMIEHCSKHSHIWFLSTDGTARNAKVNGVVRTWKHNPNRVEVPVKYGLYEYDTFYAYDINRILIPATDTQCTECGESYEKQDIDGGRCTKCWQMI